MTRTLCCALLCVYLLLSGTAAFGTSFDERLWEKYAELNTSATRSGGSLARMYLDPDHLGDLTGKTPFADLRVVTDRKEEVPWQVISKRPEKRKEEIPSQVHNLSRTESGETWLELLVDKQQARSNAVEIITPDTDFSRQVQVLGSLDGKAWNTLRKDGVIFDISQGERLRHTRITFPEASFRHLALKIANGPSEPLRISEVKVFQEVQSQGETYVIPGDAEKPVTNASRKESSIVVRMATVFPLDRLVISTDERNFQRCVAVQVKRDNGDWVPWAQGAVFNFDTPTMHESQLAIDIPQVAAKEFRLVFNNLDSPPLSALRVKGEGYSRLLVFKQQPNRKFYLFWGNPQAHQPQYDLAGVIARQETDELPRAYFASKARLNTKFAGNSARLPFTERYKHLLYVVVSMAIAGLIFMQYRHLKRVEQ